MAPFSKLGQANPSSLECSPEGTAILVWHKCLRPSLAQVPSAQCTQVIHSRLCIPFLDVDWGGYSTRWSTISFYDSVRRRSEKPYLSASKPYHSFLERECSGGMFRNWKVMILTDPVGHRTQLSSCSNASRGLHCMHHTPL